MPGTTPNEALPYPAGGDPIDIAGDIKKLADAVDPKIYELNQIIDRTPSGTAGYDYLDIKTPPNQASVRFRDISRFEMLTPGNPSPMGLHVGASAGGWGIHLGAYEASGDIFPRLVVGIVQLTGSGDPKYFYKLGSRDGAHRVRMQFQNVTDIEAAVPWPVASSIVGKTDVEPYSGDSESILASLRPVLYRRENEPSQELRVGLIAEEVDAVLPEATVRRLNAPDVDPEADGGVYGYLQDAIVAVLIDAVQKLTARVAALEAGA
jgi:hypothetical protein